MENIPYLFLGSPPIGPIALRALELADYPPAAVITDTKLSLDDLLAAVEEHKAAFILVVGFGAILKRPLLDSVAGQVLNIHPSLLPLYRGPAPVVQSILDGVSETGVTLIEIDTEVDHGPILAQESFPLQGTETANDLYNVLIQKGVKLFLEVIEDYLTEKLVPEPQDHDEATFTHFIKKEDGLLDFTQPAEVLERQIRAFQEWPKSWLVYEKKRLIIHKAHLENDRLILDEVQPENGKTMTFKAFCAGIRLKPEEFLRKYAGQR